MGRMVIDLSGYCGEGGKRRMTMVMNILLGIILIYIAMVDWKTHKITNRTLFILLLVGVGVIWQRTCLANEPFTAAECILGGIITGAPLFIACLIRPEAFGGGDIKLLAIAGGLLGWRGGLLALCAGFLSGGFYSAVMLVLGKIKRKDKFAFGPFLCIGIAIGYCIIFVNSQSSGLTVY